MLQLLLADRSGTSEAAFHEGLRGARLNTLMRVDASEARILTGQLTANLHDRTVTLTTVDGAGLTLVAS